MHRKPFLLSSNGSTRATAYVFSNKSVTIDGKTHAVWLDAVSRVCGRTYDHAARSWSETFFIGEGQDNHATPALSVDKHKHLRIAFGPHARGWNSGRFKWLISEHPNRLDAWVHPKRWTEEENFGYGATYASLIHTPRDLDAIVYRGGDYPQSVLFQYERQLGGWTQARELFRQEITPQYTNYGAVCASDAQGTLYVAAHFYNVGGTMDSRSGPPERRKSHGLAILKSADLGETWTDLRGEAVRVPTAYNERIAIPPLGADLRLGGMALDAKGRPWTLALRPDVTHRDLLLSRWTGQDWTTTDLAGHLPPERVATGGGALCFDTRGRLHTALMAAKRDAVQASPERPAWGHPATEVFHLMTDVDVEKVRCRPLSPTDEATANWLPNISLAGPNHPVEHPLILYTHGVKGEGCSPPERTEVYAVWAG